MKDINIEAAVNRIAVHGPDSVVVGKDGLAVPSTVAKERYGVAWSIVFIRDDGFSLGSWHEDEQFSYGLWKDCWTHYMLRGDRHARPIEQYPYR